ncbi:MAG TPA: 16S rRNA (uracil(1498)-N(3))-methyltransferase [Pyrinomonadaceae bacterium]|nr:16S rRNA (uracil(1498)-N(3))-methyltransferase [Pyrinomonadaceae bacterium]
MRRFYSPPETFSDGSVTLSHEETRHLRDVLRLSENDRVRVFDGEGREFEADIKNISKTSTSLDVREQVEPISPESPLHLTLASAMLKSDKFDLVVQKAVELGVAHLIPLETVRSELRPRDTMKKADRWRKIALEATKQCGRAKIMSVSEPVQFKKVSVVGNALFFTERAGFEFTSNTTPQKITAFVGPEGGWDESELDVARSNKYQLVTLGGRILRAETAAIVVTAILQHRFGDVN